jgi:uncharacterized membrane protein
MTDQPTITEFSVGGVIGRAVSIYFRNLSTFIPMSIIAYLPVWIGIAVLGDAAVPDLSAGATAGLSGSFLVLTLLAMLASYWLQAALVYGTISTMRGNRASMGETFSRSLGALGTVILLAIVISICVGLGLILFIVPGIVIAVMFWVAIPAEVVERGGVGASLKRSRELTKGHRWSIFALVVLLIVLMMLISGVLGMIIGQSEGLPAIVFQEILGMFVSGIWAVITAVAYHDLRVIKEGSGAEQIGTAMG